MVRANDRGSAATQAGLDRPTSGRDVARSVDPAGRTVPHLAELEAATARMERNRAKAFDGWPWFRPEDEEEALAEHARGESLSVEDVFGALPRPRQ